MNRYTFFMKTSHSIFHIILGFILLGCGNGEPDFSGIEGSGSPIKNVGPSLLIPIKIIGPIERLRDTLRVNNVDYDVSNTNVIINNQISLVSKLLEGQIIFASGHVRTDLRSGTLDHIEQYTAIRGPISEINNLTKSLTVMGQVVLLNNTTQLGTGIELNHLDTLIIGNYVNISGFITTTGEVLATRIDIETNTSQELVTAKLSNLNLITKQFNLNELLVDYNAIPNLNLTNNQMVTISGNLNNSGVLIAHKINNAFSKPTLVLGQRVDIEAPISKFLNTSEFEVMGIPITTIASTEYINGDASDLMTNKYIRVQGESNAKGQLLARRVNFLTQKNILISANADQIQKGSLKTLGITIAIDDKTQFQDRSTIGISFKKETDISLNDSLKIHATLTGSNITATKITRQNPMNTIQLIGSANYATSKSLSIQGITITLTPTTILIDTNGNQINLDTFLNKAPHLSIFVEGIRTPSTIKASRINLIVANK